MKEGGGQKKKRKDKTAESLILIAKKGEILPAGCRRGPEGKVHARYSPRFKNDDKKRMGGKLS